MTTTAGLSGPAGTLLEKAVAPVSAHGQRRRLARLAALTEYLQQHVMARTEA